MGTVKQDINSGSNQKSGLIVCPVCQAETTKYFPAYCTARKSKKKQRDIYDLEDFKRFDRREVRKIRKTTERERLRALEKKTKTEIIEWMLFEIGLETGLRIQEIANLCCRDFYMKDGIFHILVRSGKGNKPGSVICSRALKRNIEWFIKWKLKRGEEAGESSPMFHSYRTGRQMTRQGLHKAFKRVLQKTGLNNRYGTHTLRRTFARALYDRTKNIELTRQQLRHESIITTQVYLGIDKKYAQKAVDGMYT